MSNTLRRLLGVVACGVVLSLLAAPAARADVFVFKLLPYDGGVPVINLTGPGGTSVPCVLDTGAGAEMAVLGSGAISDLGLDTSTGTPSRTGGVGGSTASHSGVDVPDTVAPETAPITPPGQTETSPDLPDETITVSSGTDEAILGSEWFNGYNYGRVQGAECDYWYMSTKDMGADGLAEGVAIANFFANPEPPLAPEEPRLGARSQDLGSRRPGIQPIIKPVAIPRPKGTVGTVLAPAPPAGLPPAIEPLEGGWELKVGITGANGTFVMLTPLLLKSGSPHSLLSRKTAETLGFDVDSLPTMWVDTDLGFLNVPAATVSVHLFPGQDFPKRTVTVGILDDPINLTGWDFLGADLLNQTSYWEVSSVEDDGLTRFYAAP